MMKSQHIGWLAALLLAACGVEQQAVVPQTSGTSVQQDPLMDFVNNHRNRQPSSSSNHQSVPVRMPFFNQPAPSVAHNGFATNPNVMNFIRYQQAQGQDAGYLAAFFANVRHKSNIINIMNRPGTSQPWYKFRTGNAGGAKVKGGRRFYNQHRAVIDRVAREYGVPASIIVAIIGIETNYGANAGNIRVADSLATLAFDYPRRGEYFQKELAEFLTLAREEGRDPLSFKGSFAGAMGMPQFMPSSFRKWAVDYDRDGRRNIWSSIPDVAASVANYMKVHGWQTGGKMIVPVSLRINPTLEALIDEKTSLKYTVGQLRQMGVMPLQAIGDGERAVLFRLEVAPGRYDYFIGLNNFYAVWQYNHSRKYVTAVRDIANAVGADGL